MRARKALKHVHVAFVTGQNLGNCVLIDSRDNGLIPPTQLISDVLTKVPFHWTLHLAGFGRKENGQEFMEYEVISTQNRYLQSDLVDYLNQRHSELLKGMNQKRLVGAGWLANISNQELDEATLISVFQSLDAWS